MQKNRKILLAVMLMLSIGTFTRITGNENIRAVQFLAIFAIGALTALLIKELVGQGRNPKTP
jgi:TM2 domain-containing membrane protein YozV